MKRRRDGRRRTRRPGGPKGPAARFRSLPESHREVKSPMPLYMYQAGYAPESLAAQIKEPQDRLEAVKPLLEAAGARLVVGGYPFGDYDVLVIYEAPDDAAAAAIALAVGAGGAVRGARTTKLLTGQEWVAALRKAQSVAPQYRPAA